MKKKKHKIEALLCDHHSNSNIAIVQESEDYPDFEEGEEIYLGNFNLQAIEDACKIQET